MESDLDWVLDYLRRVLDMDATEEAKLRRISELVKELRESA